MAVNWVSRSANRVGFGAEPTDGQYQFEHSGGGGTIGSWFTANTNPNSGLNGWTLWRAANSGFPLGWTLCEKSSLNAVSRIWDFGLDASTTDFAIYSHGTLGDVLRIKQTNGQMEWGPVVGTPTSNYQLNLTAGTSGVPLDGIQVRTFGNKAGINLLPANGTTKRTKITFNSTDWQIGEDQTENNTANFWLFNGTTSLFPLTIGTNDQMTLGTTHANSELKIVSGKLGFFNLGAPVAKQTVSGAKGGTPLSAV